MQTAIFKPVINYPKILTLSLEKDIFGLFSVCVENLLLFFSFKHSEHLSHGHFLLLTHTWIYMLGCYFVYIFRLWQYSCYNLLSELSSLTGTMFVCIYRYYLFEWCSDVEYNICVSESQHEITPRIKTKQKQHYQIYMLSWFLVVFIWHGPKSHAPMDNRSQSNDYCIYYSLEI